ncbi:hypothetical protein GGR58DRAFT_513099 [Xylaria digitata]|nr:hypothetical protein GGR58DRAFT_513099 [Xylaria digitata]
MSSRMKKNHPANRFYKRILQIRILGRIWQRYIATSTGWHRAAKINCALLAVINIILLIILIYAAAKSPSILSLEYIYSGSCNSDGIPLVNLFLHLLINIISTLVVLNAPSREELDSAHIKGTWMEVGASSIRNVFKVSSFKRWCWFALMITSLPIHLFFNSFILSTEYRQSDYTVTIASERFVNSGSFYLPGASLYTLESELFNNISIYPHYGDGVYYGRLFKVWDRLSFTECQKEFGVYGVQCSGVTRYSDLILIVDRPGGWVRSDMWHLTEDQTHFWDSYVPADKPNHLFFYTSCYMQSNRVGACANDCTNALGGRVGFNIDKPTVQQWPSGFPFFFDKSLEYVNGTYSDLAGHLVSGLQPGHSTLSPEYCLAKPLQTVCYIGISPVLLLSVVLCLITKTAIAILVTRAVGNRGQRSLVTLGDCMASFIENPDLQTSDYPAVSIADFQRIFLVPGPRQWRDLYPRRATYVPRAVWTLSFVLFATSIAVCLYLLSTTSGETFSGSFLASSRNPLVEIEMYTFLLSVLIANSPQVLLSVSYIVFNNLFTYFCVAIEWQAFSSNYLPLRVTNPEGEQISTYRLQLPYRYSLPLMALASLFHWLVSNTIYVIVSEGGYFSTGLDPNLPANASVVLGFSPISLVVLTVIASLTVTIPLIFSLRRFSSTIVIVGTNSLLISLACHVSPLVSSASNNHVTAHVEPSEYELPEYPMITSNPERSEESNELLGSAASERGLNGYSISGARDDESLSPRQKIARSKIRWGVLPMPPEWLQRHDYEPLGFRVETDEITIPVQDRWYQ